MELSIKSEKQTTTPEVIVRVKRKIMQKKNWFHFEFSVESSNFTFNNFKTEKFKLRLKVKTDQFVICVVLLECLSVKICCISPSSSEANRDGADAESPFPLSFSFSASFKNSSPKEKVGNCLRFGTGGWSLFLSIMVAKYLNIFPHANNGCSLEKKILAKRFAYAISRHYRDLEHPYVY